MAKNGLAHTVAQDEKSLLVKQSITFEPRSEFNKTNAVQFFAIWKSENMLTLGVESNITVVKKMLRDSVD
jgi:hypothetical protein